MASFKRMANGNIEAHLTENEARVIQSVVSRVGGVSDTTERRDADRVLEALDELLGEGQGGRFFGGLVATDLGVYDFPEGSKERATAVQASVEAEQLMYVLADRLGMLEG